MASNRIRVEPAVLTWARESLGLDAETAAKRLGISLRTLTSWEVGELDPTIRQLRTAARVYRRPLAVLLLSEPPKDFDPIKDYRAGAAGTTSPSPELQAEIRRVFGQREVFLELAEFDPDSVPEPVPLPRVDIESHPEVVGVLLREWIGVGLDDQYAARDKYEALNLWVRPIEEQGVLVVNFSGVDTDEVAGFSISEWPYTVIAINGADWPRRRLFTLLHELAHLALNTGGLCDLHEATIRRTKRDDLEHFCNSVAAAALIPREALLVQLREIAGNVDLELVSDLAEGFSVSSESLLLRLVSVGAATWDTYWKLKPELEELYREARERKREDRRGQSAPLFYQTKARDLGHAYISSVLDAYESRAISSLDVADYLDIKFNQIPKLARVVGRQ